MIKKKEKRKLLEQLNKEIIDAIQNKKGYNITLIDLENIDNAVCDFFVICHGTSDKQVEALADSVEEGVKKNTGQSPIHVEGYANAEWIVLDYFDVIVHIFQEEKRNFYQLESLWGDAKITNIENKY